MKKILKETDPRFYHLEKKVGVFVTSAIVLLVLLFIGIKHDIFTPKYTLFFTADRGRNISEGMPVKLSGFKIGKVSSLSLDEQAKVKVEMAVYRKYIKWIRQDATAKLVKEGGLWGDNVIEITGGSTKFPPIENKSSMNFERSKDLDDVIEELKPTLAEIKGMINYVNDPQGDIKVTLGNLRKISEQIFVTKAELDKLIKNTNNGVLETSAEVKTLMVELNKSVSQAENTLKNLDTAVSTVNKDLPQIMSNLSKSAENIERITQELNKKVPAVLDDTKEILDGAKKSWPINTMVAPPQEKPLKSDSFE